MNSFPQSHVQSAAISYTDMKAYIPYRTFKSHKIKSLYSECSSYWNAFLFLCIFYFIVDTVTDVPHCLSFVLLHPALLTPPWPSPHCCPCPWAVHTWIYVTWLISSSPTYPTPLCDLPHASGFILFVSLFGPLDSMYEWDHMVFVFLWLAYFA